ncbi:MAG: ATP-binding cassette domain-containing protein [Oscillospiraceae bacterium]|nr:ATP-binding cassette domain-containing protein [Oscillospiraceae bacterium]
MLQVRDLTKIYRSRKGAEVRALDGVTLTFPETGMVFLLGKSGSGKSTLLNVCGGLDNPTSGEVIVKGRSSKDFSQSDFDSYRNTFIGFIFQEYNILNEFSVEDNIALALELQGKSKDKKAIAALLDQVELSDFAKRKPNTLSGGQKQRIAIARALIKNPEIIMADEPTGALDSRTGKQVFDILKKLSKEKLVIVVSHDHDFAEQYGDRIIELKDGQVISDVTKYTREKTAISENISAMGDVLCVKNGAALSDGDFEQIRAFLKTAEKDVLIAVGEKDVENFRQVSRIHEDGAREVFDETAEIPVKQYTKEESRFIRSRLPMHHAVKIGLSGLKSKPFRLLLTILLCTVAFTLFGLLTTLNFYDSETSFKESLAIADETVVKMNKEYLENVQTYMNGVEDYAYETRAAGTFGEDELNAYRSTLSPDTFGAVESTHSYGLRSAASKYWFPDIAFYGYLPEDNSLRGRIQGEYPDAEDEIVISSYSAQVLVNCGTYDHKGVNITVSEPSELIGQRIAIDRTEYTITGILDSGVVDPKYDTILMGEYEDNFFWEYETYLNDSLHLTAYVSYDRLCDIYEQTRFVRSGYRDFSYVAVARFEDGEQKFGDYSDANYVKFSEMPEDLIYYPVTGDAVTADNEAVVDFRIVSTYLLDYNAVYAVPQEVSYEDYEAYEAAMKEVEDFMNAVNGAAHGYGWEYPEDGGEAEEILYTDEERIDMFKKAMAYMIEHDLLGELNIKLASATDMVPFGDSETYNIVGAVLDLREAGWNSIYIADGKADALWEQQKHTAQYYDVSTTEYVAAEDAVYTTVFVPYVYSEAVAEEMWKIFTADGIEEGLVSEVNYSSAFISNLRTVDTTVKQLSKTFLIVGLILAVFAVLLFSNFISASISQKTRDIGILRAVGARGTDVFRIFFSESFVIVLICAALSIAASYVVCGVIDAQLNEGIGATILSFGVMSVAVLLVSAFFTALISTFLPVYNAARKKPVESIRSL